MKLFEKYFYGRLANQKGSLTVTDLGPKFLSFYLHFNPVAVKNLGRS
jgi:hypothetical protein